MEKIRRLKPGSCSTVAAIMTAQGEITADPALMLEDIRTHWAAVFSPSPTNEELRHKWYEEELGDSGPWANTDNDKQWDISRKSVQRASKHSGSSSPGSDGIPYAAWRKLGPLGIDTITAAATHIAYNDLA